MAFVLIPQAGAGLAQYLILAGFALNAAVFPLHAWLPDAYPEATVTGAVFMCAYTTKTAVYVLARAFPGYEVLAIMGTAMTIYGVVYATIENDMRRILSYHIISQVGYMVAGVGIGTELALNGACAHAYAHILYKALLFMGAGAVLQMTGRSKLNELGGLYKYMPLSLIFYVVGGISISGFPLFSGFVSKSLIVAGAGEAHHNILMVLLLLASVGTFLSVGLKLPYFAWFGKDCGLTPKEPPKNMLWAMGLTSLLCLFIGVYPRVLYDLLPLPGANTIPIRPITFRKPSRSCSSPGWDSFCWLRSCRRRPRSIWISIGSSAAWFPDSSGSPAVPCRASTWPGENFTGPWSCGSSWPWPVFSPGSTAGASTGWWTTWPTGPGRWRIGSASCRAATSSITWPWPSR